MGGWLISGAGLVGFAALCLWFVPQNARSIERDVLHRTTKALNDGHIAIPRDGVRISGRDITLSAPHGEALVSDATRELVMTIEGVRSVQLKTTPDR
jgi:hypothetical protein